MVLSRQSHGLTGRRSVIATTIALLVALSVGSCAIPEEEFDGSIEGNYYINGFDHLDVEYSGLLTVTTTDIPEIYDMQWIITGSVQKGTGRLEGDQLFVEWQAIEGYDASSYGTAVFEVSEDGELRGERTIAGQVGVATEEAFPVK